MLSFVQQKTLLVSLRKIVFLSNESKHVASVFPFFTSYQHSSQLQFKCCRNNHSSTSVTFPNTYVLLLLFFLFYSINWFRLSFLYFFLIIILHKCQNRAHAVPTKKNFFIKILSEDLLPLSLQKEWNEVNLFDILSSI